VKPVRHKQPDVSRSLDPPARKAGPPRGVLLLLAAALAVVVWRAVTMGSGTTEVRQLSIGESATTDQGTTVTVAGWKAESASEADKSQIDVKSCRTSPDQQLISARSFGLVMPNGKTLEPDGSELTVVENCVEGAILFPATSEKPRAVVLDKGSVTLSWALNPAN
jgi:hypothetical protein